MRSDSHLDCSAAAPLPRPARRSPAISPPTPGSIRALAVAGSVGAVSDCGCRSTPRGRLVTLQVDPPVQTLCFGSIDPLSERERMSADVNPWKIQPWRASASGSSPPPRISHARNRQRLATSLDGHLRFDISSYWSGSRQETVDEPGDLLRVLLVDEEFRVGDCVKPDDVRELPHHLPSPRLGKGRIVRAPDEERRHREPLMEVFELVQPRKFHSPQETHGTVHPSVRADERLDERFVKFPLQGGQVMEAAAEDQRRPAKRRGLQQLLDD